MAQARSRTRQRSARAAGDGNGNGGGKPVSLDDLTPAQRAKLLKEAKAEVSKTSDPDADAWAERRGEQIAELMDIRDHMRDCPMDGRYEAFGARKPARPDEGESARDVTVVRCIECAGTVVLDEAYESVIDRLDQELGKGD